MPHSFVFGVESIIRRILKKDEIGSLFPLFATFESRETPNIRMTIPLKSTKLQARRILLYTL